MIDSQEWAQSAREPVEAPTLVRALWREKHGDWEGAHELAQEADTPSSAWVHAYLHRREGDLPNAAYWYRVANQPVAKGSLEDEWQCLWDAMLNESSSS